MKIILISTGNKNDRGPRAISDFINRYDHKTKILFYKWNNPQNISCRCKNAGLIVVSANVKTRRSASNLINYLKKLKKPIVYAGIYATDFPEECMKETDLVITGKPAETILELANRLENFQRISDIENLLFRVTKESIIKN